MSDLILPTRMAKARKKDKIKVAEEGKTVAELEEKQKEVEKIYPKAKFFVGKLTHFIL